ncbi:hypothetical protein Hypma_003931 [Hypsizygus marmoreus]|uniref:Uncharacterized protein n=1 Tax=Hypsizygus marmoreus TaxID=39966 RepID=A0A369J7I3_HYPMA|nr:hypothetical protein Hypma_003931 [Hypsizygus marmoreus]
MSSTNDPQYGLQSIHRAGQQSPHPRVIVELFSIFAFRIAHITISKLVDALSIHVSSPVLTAFILVSIYALIDMERTRSRARFMYETMSGLVHGVQESAEDVVHELLDCPPRRQAAHETPAVLTIILWTRTTRSERRLRSSRRRRMVRAGIERERIRVGAGRRGLRVLRVGRATGGGGSRRGRRYGVDSIAGGGGGGGGVGSENETEDRVMQISCPLGNKVQI